MTLSAYTIRQIENICSEYRITEHALYKTIENIRNVRQHANRPIRNALKITCEYYGVDENIVMTGKRKREHVDVRAIVSMLVRDRYSLSHIGRFFGKNHCTILALIKNPKNVVMKEFEIIKKIYEQREKN